MRYQRQKNAGNKNLKIFLRHLKKEVKLVVAEWVKYLLTGSAKKGLKLVKKTVEGLKEGGLTGALRQGTQVAPELLANPFKDGMKVDYMN